MENVERLREDKPEHYYNLENEAFPEGDDLLENLNKQLNFLNDKFKVYHSLETVSNYNHFQVAVNKAEGDEQNPYFKEVQM